MSSTIDPPATNPFASLTGNGVVVIPWRLGMQIGCGYDSLNAQVKGVPFNQADIKETKVNGKVQSVGANIQRVENTEDLTSLISSDTDASVGYGIVSVTASVKFMTSTAINTYSLYYLVKSQVYNEPKFLENDNPSFLPSASSSAPIDFFNKFGDYYVEGVISGSEYYALLEIHTKSTKEKQSLTTSLDVGVKTGKLDASVKESFTREISSAVESKNISYVTAMSGVAEVQTPLDSISSIIDFAAALPSKSFPGENLYAILKPYSLLEKGTDVTLKYDLEFVDTVKKSLAAVANRANFILNSVNYAISHLSEFSDDVSRLQDLQKQLLNLLQKVLQIRQSLAKDPFNTKIDIPALPSDNMLPLHISSDQKDSYFPPIVTADGILAKFESIYKLFYKGTTFTEFPELKVPVSKLLNSIQSKFLTTITDGSGFMEQYISTMEGLRDEESTADDRGPVVSDLQNFVSQSYWRAFQLIPANMNSLVESSRSSFNDTKYDTYFQEILKFVNSLFTSSTNDGVSGAFWKDIKNVTDAFSLLCSFWTSGDNRVTDLCNPNISLWKELKKDLDKFREGVASYVF